MNSEENRARDIIDLVIREYGLPRWKFYNKGRAQHVVFVRQLAMFLVRKHTRLSFPAIAGMFFKDHSTIIYAYMKVKAQERRLKAEIQRIEAVIPLRNAEPVPHCATCSCYEHREEKAA